VKSAEQARAIAEGADVVVVGSALVDALGPEGTDVARLAALVAALREGARRGPGAGG
jgi:tryptophan synthase alpha subunit